MLFYNKHWYRLDMRLQGNRTVQVVSAPVFVSTGSTRTFTACFFKKFTVFSQSNIA